MTGWLIMYQNKLKTSSAKPFQEQKIVYWGCMMVLRLKKAFVEAEAEKENQEEEYVDLTPHEHERALKGAYRNFVIPGAPKTDIYIVILIKPNHTSRR